MWIVKLALRRPYTFIVLAIVITLFGAFAIWRTPTDIFPNIRIPVVATVWKYTGLSPEEMATRLILNGERTAQTTVNDVEHTESQSVSGTSVVKYFFQPNVNEELSYAQITGVSQTMIRFAPPGTTAPFVLAYNASSVPVLQLALSSPSLSEAQLFDQGNSIIRTALSTVAGASMPWPYGGLQRQVQVDLDPDALRAPDQHRTPRRSPRCADERAQDRQRLDARHHPRHQGTHAADPRRAAPGLQDRPGGRSVDLRARRDLGRRARSGDRRKLDRAHDSPVPRHLAQHPHHRDLDPALDPRFDHLPVGARRDHQHHDPRGAGPRGRYSGR